MREDLARRDRRDSERKTAPLMIALGATIVNNSGQTPKQTSECILAEIHRRLGPTADCVHPAP